MLQSTPSLPRLCRTAVLALGCAVSVVALHLPVLNAADAPASLPTADKAAPALPLTATFEKVSGAEGSPYVLKLKNDSKETIKASARVLLAVAFHAENKARVVPEHAIKAGDTWSVHHLAAGDKVIVTAKGFAALELLVK